MQNRYVVIPVMRTDEGYTISDQTLSYIWDKMVEEKKNETVFYNGAVANLGDFIAYMRRDDVFPVVVYDRDESKFNGIAWLNNLNEGTAQGHFCLLKGGNNIVKGHEVLAYWKQFPTDVTGVIIGIVPAFNKAAVKFIGKLGFTTVGEIPNYCNTVYMADRTPGVVMYKEL